MSDQSSVANELNFVPERRLGRLPGKSTPKALMFDNFVKFLKLPAKTNYWKQRAEIPIRTYGNTEYGSCTRSKQAVAATRMERIEQRRLIEITDDEVIRVYREMSDRLYGGGDNGAYEDDALSEWRKPDTTFRDTKGSPYTIDAFLRINPKNIDEVKAAIALSGSKGIAVCFNLPWAFAKIEPPNEWDLPSGQMLIGDWMPGSWGGHSQWAFDYSEQGIWLDHTWNMPPQLITWNAVATYMDEAHVVIDSVDSWRKKTSTAAKINIKNVIAAVNDVSSYRIAA
jgi:hypothetical protein